MTYSVVPIRCCIEGCGNPAVVNVFGSERVETSCVEDDHCEAHGNGAPTRLAAAEPVKDAGMTEMAKSQVRAGSTPFQDEPTGSGPSRERLDGPAAITLRTMQAEVAEWHRREFPDASFDQLGLIVGEEAGEVQRCVLKMGQGIRRETDWRAELEKECADVLGSILALADRFDFDLESAWVERFRGTIRHRQFASAGVIPGQESLL